VPAVTLSTDIIVGFPGETAEDFEQTLSLLDVVQYHSVFSFKYSPRPARWPRSGCPMTWTTPRRRAASWPCNPPSARSSGS
jgi:hypothetical protein